MSVPAIFVIGDSLSFRCDNVKSERTGDYLPDATLTYALLDADTRIEVTSGAMSIYDSNTASFEAVIADTDLQVFDPDDNPTGIVPERQYILRSTVDNDGVKTSKARRLVAKLDPPDED